MIIEVDLGATNSRIVVLKNNKEILIPNAQGNFLTPSVVSIDLEGNILVGSAAIESNSRLSFANFIRYMGTLKVFRRGSYAFYPEELSAYILKSLIRNAETYLNIKITEAVYKVPSFLNNSQCKAFQTAGELAGVEMSFNNPTAADVCPFTVGTHIVEDKATGSLRFYPIIEQNSTIPTTRLIQLSTIHDNQTQVELGFYQNESSTLDDSEKIGELIIIVPPQPAGQETIELRFTYSSHKLLEIQTTVKSTGKQRKLIIDFHKFELSEEYFCDSLLRVQDLKVDPLGLVKTVDLQKLQPTYAAQLKIT